MGQSRWSCSALLGLGVFALGLLKLSWLTFSGPLLAYANNYDFLRQSACIGVWQWKDGIDKTAGNYQFPIGTLINDGQRLPDMCLYSIDTLFPWLTGLIQGTGAVFDIAWVGGLKVLAFAVLSAALLHRLSTALRVPMALVFFLIAGDWVFAAYANTLYLEFSVVAGCFLVLVAGTQLLAQREAPAPALLVLCVMGLVWLGWSKLQYGLLASCLAVGFALVLFGRWRCAKTALVLLVLALLLPFSYSQLNDSRSPLMQGLNHANKTNTFQGAVLPAAVDPAEALQRLGLPPSCAAGIGHSWYTPRVNDVHLCPEVQQVSRLALPGLFIAQPSTFFVPLHRAIIESRPFYPHYLGKVEPEAGAKAERKVHRAQVTSITTAMAALPLALYVALVYAGLLAAALALTRLAWSFRRGGLSEESRAIAAMLGLGGVVGFYALVSSVFGDGYIELQKHAVALPLALIFQSVGLLWGVFAWGRRIASAR
ncbi:MAG: hypothetical protein V4812_00055 [Pseudomonadota bacterium]